ncbi:hypothetical protein D3C78_526380 [compost metagenome]
MLAVCIPAILQHLHVVPQALSAVLVEIDNVVFLANDPDKPDSGGVAHADVPEGVHRQVAVVGQLADTLGGVEPGELLGVVRALDRLLECLGRDRRVLTLHVVAEGLFLGGVPGALAWIGNDPVFCDQVVKILGQAVRDQDVGRVKPVQRIPPPAEEEELPVQKTQGHAG